MPKALFFNVPAHGHINPTLPLVAELTRHGHEIIYFTTENYRARIEAAGAAVRIYDGVADDYFDSRGLNGSMPQKAAAALLATTKTILPKLLEDVNQMNPDYILYDCMCPWGYFVAQIVGLPAVSSASLLPLSPRVMLNWQIVGLFLPMLTKGLRAGIEANRLSQELGQQYNLKPLSMMNILNAPGDLVISYSSPAYVPLAQQLPDHVKLIGWTLLNNNASEPFRHDSERPLIYISLGTVINENKGFYEVCIAALGGLPFDVLISTGGRFSPAQFGPLPDNITIKSWVPQSQVLQQSALFITHGGLNSLHDGLYCGVPLLVVPQQAEQTFNGLRVVELGAGLMLKKPVLTAITLRDRVHQLLAEGRYKSQAERIGDTLRSAGGAARAVAEIEGLLRA